MESFTFNQLRYFYKLAQTLNYRIAAEELYISQPALSKQIKDLETVVGVRLFQKIGRNIKLTNPGEEFVIHVARILQDVERTNRSMKRFTDSKNSYVKIGVSGSQIIYSIISEFNHQFPNAKLQLQELRNAEIIEGLKKHQLDAGLTFLPVYDTALTSKYVFSDEIVAVTSDKNSGFKDKNVTTMSELTNFPIATLEENFHLRKLLDHYFQSHLLMPDYQFELKGYNSCVNIVQNSDAVTLIPKSYLQSETYAGIRVLKIEDGLMPIRIGFTYLKENDLAESTKQLFYTLVHKFRK